MSTPRSRRTLFALALTASCTAGAAGAADETAAQYQRIAQSRAAVERDARAAHVACATEFAMTACVDAVKAERRQRLRGLDLERALLDEQARRRRAAERLARVQQRQAALAEAPAPVIATPRLPPPSTAVRAVAVPSAPSAASAAAEREAAASRADADAARRAAATAQRASEAQRYRAEVELRQRDRAQRRAPAAPLPLPADAPASR